MHKLKYTPDWEGFICDDGLFSLAHITSENSRGGIDFSGLPDIKEFGKFSFEQTSIELPDEREVKALRTRQEGTDNKPHFFYVTFEEGKSSDVQVFLGRNNGEKVRAEVGGISEVDKESIWAPDGNLQPGFVSSLKKSPGVVVLDEGEIHKFGIRGGSIMEQIQMQQKGYPVSHLLNAYTLEGKRIRPKG